MSMPVIATSDATKCDALADIIQSIALIEAAISHILNAGGEEIQAAVGSLNSNLSPIATTTNELLQINESIQNLLASVAALEEILQTKLNTVLAVDCPTDTTTTAE